MAPKVPLGPFQERLSDANWTPVSPSWQSIRSCGYVCRQSKGTVGIRRNGQPCFTALGPPATVLYPYRAYDRCPVGLCP
jgi:hypothetical protein